MKLIGERRFSVNDSSHDGGGRTVLVGMKLDPQSRQLLTWALVKIAKPGDSVVAVHVLETITGSVGTASLLSFLKTLDSILAVYEGFCCLKQVDLKLKVCRGPSVRKLLIGEAIAHGAEVVVVGTSNTHHRIRSSTSVANYCARKLPKYISVFAIDNSKVAFRREACKPCPDQVKSNKGHAFTSKSFRGSMEDEPMNCETCAPALVQKKNSGIQLRHDQESNHGPNCSRKSFSSNMKKKLKNLKSFALALPETSAAQHRHELPDDGERENLFPPVPISKHESVSKSMIVVQNSPLSTPGCSQKSFSALVKKNLKKLLLEYSGTYLRDNCKRKNSLALVPIQEPEDVSHYSGVTPELPQSNPGCSLHCQVFLPSRHVEKSFVEKVSALHWVLRQPSRHSSAIVYPDELQFNAAQDDVSSLDGENGVIVPFTGFPVDMLGLQNKYSSTCRFYSYQELMSATANFIPENLVGQGGSSYVYKGCLPDGKELAVKILKSSENVLKDFFQEIEIITTLHHKNIISLSGFCFEDNNLVLVYGFLSRGSLEENLHGNKEDGNVFSLRERYKVALGVAEALEYLHNGCAHPVIHRDIKSSNILLSDDFEPQLSDFGLASWASCSSNIPCADVAGTFGYMDPEYFMHGRVTEKSDVYAFGVVLLELLSSKRPINDYPKREESLVKWATPILKCGDLSQLLDSSISRYYDQSQIERMALAANLCIRRDPRFRPQINIILKLLHGDEEVTRWAKQETSALEKDDALDEEPAQTSILSHLNLALLDLEDDSLSMSSIERRSISLEDYLQGKWSHLPSIH
ncbi:Protein kinase family protein [Quillaja saponaria]|uniref:Protein kinase family protein n=1 Tax=Quillaja saponaria TaxID=32244 RepID=A0AAD7PAV3_QUISA|nr:Protein kinase family protein [Quillaja saponaria]